MVLSPRSAVNRVQIHLAAALAIGLCVLGVGSRELWAQSSEDPTLLAPPPAGLFGDLSASPEPILSAIESMESDSDAKCHSSASRFEDFLYGTPLNADARQRKSDLQKQLVVQIWGAASQAATRAGEPTVTADRVREQVDPLFQWERDSAGQIEVRFPGAEAMTLETARTEQYGSIAYSLRVILAVEQDSILSGGDSLVTLEAGAIDLLRESIDKVTLSALMLADQSARERNEFEVTPARVQTAWQRLLPNSRPVSSEVPARTVESPGPDSRAQGLALLDAMIDKKGSAYRAYNDLDKHEMSALLRSNIARFYARNPLPEGPRERAEIERAMNAHLDEFSVALFVEAGANAQSNGHSLIRADDANRAVQKLIPNQIDEFEDVHLFGRLAEQERITLEAYDCDSFRDSGIHWPSLKRALRRVSENVALPDPFAAEIIAEAVSQYGVLLFRLAGTIAKRNTDNVRLQAEDLATSAALIQERASRHHEAPAVTQTVSRIASAPADPSGDRPAVFFTEVTEAAGVDFAHRSSTWLGEYRHKPRNTPPTFSGGGVAAEDIDGDSDFDLLFVGGIGNALLINDGYGHFTDVTKQVGINVLRSDGTFGEARTPIIADFDNDGRQDILITYVDDDHRLYRNTGGLHFEDVSSTSGLGGKGLIGGPATVFDFDNDGLLDIYLAHIGDYLHGAVPTADRDNRNALPNRLFRNLGGMRFQDVSEGSGAADTGWAQAVSHVDFDRDGRQDIIVANDFGRNVFLRNLGDGKFENVAPELGLTKAFHSMNVGISDLNDDGYPDIYISNIATLVKDNKYVFPDVTTPMKFDLRAMAGMLVKEADVLYMSRLEGGDLGGYEPSKDVERGETSTGWAWDAEFFDFDHDGDDDLYVVNGMNDYNALPTIYQHQSEDGKTGEYLLNHSRESNVFFVNQGGKLKNMSVHSGVDFVGNSRSAVYLDFDGDGDLDIAVNNFHAPARLFRNNSEQRGLNWLKIRLIGDPSRGSNRDAIGARIRMTAEDVHSTREIQGGSGYLSMNPKQQHFGLSRSAAADVHIIWPNGEEQVLTGVAANRSYTVHQGVGITSEPLASGSEAPSGS